MKVLNQILIKSQNSSQELLGWNIKKIRALHQLNFCYGTLEDTSNYTYAYIQIHIRLTDI